MPENTKQGWDGKDRRAEGRSGLVADIASAVRDQLAGLTVPEELHREHHAFISAYLEEQRIKRERNERIKTQVFGWTAVTILSGIGTAAYHAVQYLKEHLR